MRKNKIGRRVKTQKKPESVQPAAEPVPSEKNLPEVEICQPASGGGEEAGQAIQPSPANSGKRKCECCGTVLSMYNTDNLCRPCDRTINAWQLFPHLRRETNLPEHCRDYIESRGARRRREIDEGVSSGSWARAMGKNMSRKKEG